MGQRQSSKIKDDIQMDAEITCPPHLIQWLSESTLPPMDTWSVKIGWVEPPLQSQTFLDMMESANTAAMRYILQNGLQGIVIRMKRISGNTSEKWILHLYEVSRKSWCRQFGEAGQRMAMLQAYDDWHALHHDPNVEGYMCARCVFRDDVGQIIATDTDVPRWLKNQDPVWHVDA